MKLFEQIKSYFGEQALASHLKNQKRDARMCNIDSAQSIGILFNATHLVSFEIVKELAKNLDKKGRTIEVLGYVDSKQLIDHYLYRKGFNFFTRTQLNWYNKPEDENIDTFIRKPFDILLDLSLDNPFPIKYILACSIARFKAGRYTDEQMYLDLMIDIQKELETMSTIKDELEKDIRQGKKTNRDVEKIVDKKAETEIQLNFLINQLLHYLSILKN